MKLLFIFPGLLLLFTFVWLAEKVLKIRSEYTRKLVHMGSALLAFLFPYFLTIKEIVAVALIFVVLLLITRHKKWLGGIHQVKRKTWGEIYFPLSIGLVALLFLPKNLEAYQFGVLVMGISDGLAALVGMSLGKHYLPFINTKKSWEGTGAFAISTFILFLLLAPALMAYWVMGGLAITIGLALIELSLSWGLDNLFLPLAAGLLMKLVIG